VLGTVLGTVLGPLLFLCHINDIVDGFSSTIRLFADVCLLYRVINSIQDQIALQEDLKCLELWAECWGMSFNAGKCKILVVKGKLSYFYTIGNTILEQITNSPYLGLDISDDLKWDRHISRISKKANSTLGFLCRNLRGFNQDHKRVAYIALVCSILEYGSVVWDPYTKGNIERLEHVQRCAARFMTNDYTTKTPGCVTDMLNRLELIPLEDRRKNLRLTFMYKVVEGLVPAIAAPDFLTPFKPGRRRIKAKTFGGYSCSNIVERSVRLNSKPFIPPSTRTLQYKNLFFV